MPSKVTLVAVLGLVALSMGIPVEESVPYNPQDFYPPSYTLDGSNAPEENAVALDKLPYNPRDFYPPSYTLDGSNALEEPAVDLDKLPYNPQDFYSSPLLDSLSESSGSRIVGGTEAKEGSAPYMMSLFMGALLHSFLCGGSMVTPFSVVTAAHCVDPMVSWIDGQLMDSAHGRIGSNSLSKDYSVVRFAGYENHPGWDSWLIKNDIGVLKLAEKIEWSKRVQPLRISYDFVGGGQVVRVTGWGRLSAWGNIPDRLQELSVHVLSPKECEEGIREAIGSSPPVHPKIELCTRHKRGAGYGMCNGDSGSALVLEQRLVAIVSWGWPCAIGNPDVHARASGFADWLPRVLRNCRV